jgi:tRNA(adenine34) deaminase
MASENLEWNFMHLALQEAIKAYKSNEVPVGAIIVQENRVVGTGYNQVILKQSVSSHAEINAINNASENLKNYRLINCDMYVTLEPCHMCAKAIVDARIRKLYFGALEPKTGSIVSCDTFFSQKYLNHSVSFEGGIRQEESSKLLKKFFSSRRNSKKLSDSDA